MQEKLIRALKERFPNDNRPPDGLIYERIRHYEGLPGPRWRRFLGAKSENTCGCF